MMIFIFIAAILEGNMDGSTSHSFLSSSPGSQGNQTLDDDEASGWRSARFDEIFLLVSILCYNSFAGVGVMILPWTLSSELYPIKVSEGGKLIIIFFCVASTDSELVNLPHIFLR